MAFALTGYKSFGIRAEGATRKHADQCVEMVITGTAADVALDIDTDAGTFWTAAQANTTYGALATTALTAIKAIQAAAVALIATDAFALLNKVKVAALTGAGQFTLVVTNKRPNIAFNAGDGGTQYHLRMTWVLPDGIEALVNDLGVTE